MKSTVTIKNDGSEKQATLNGVTHTISEGLSIQPADVVGVIDQYEGMSVYEPKKKASRTRRVGTSTKSASKTADAATKTEATEVAKES